MSKRGILLMLLLLVSLATQAQVVNMGGSSSGTADGSYSFDKIQKSTVRLLTIGIGDFEDKDFDELKSYSILDSLNVKKVTNNIRLNYKDFYPQFLNKKKVDNEEVIYALEELMKETTSDDLVIISILSHGVQKINEHNENEYYLVCSNTKKDNYPETAVSGTQIRRYIESMANKGAVVIVFLDTCHASALFEKSDPVLKGNGAIAYYGSALSDEKAMTKDNITYFSSAIVEIFQNRKKDIFNTPSGFATIKSLSSQIKSAVDASEQTPMSKYITNISNFEEFPIFKKEKFKPYGSIWKKENRKAFSPIAISPGKGKGWDYSLIALQATSIIGFFTCGIIQEDCKSKINSTLYDVEKCNNFRVRGKNAAIGCCVSTALFAASYGAKVLHFHYQNKKIFENNQYATTLNIDPSISPNYTGLALVYNF